MSRSAIITIFPTCILGAVVGSVVVSDVAGREGGSRDVQTAEAPQSPAVIGHPTFLSPHASPIAISAGRVFVANTPADTVDVIDADSREVLARVHVGIDPVSVAVRPDGKEV